MQSVAQSWLVYTLTHSSTDLGLVVAVQTLPVLVLGPYAGVVADRVDKRRLMVALQSLMGVQALVLGLLTVLNAVTFSEVCVLAAALGLNNTFENPARQSFVLEMVGRGNVRNAVSLNSTMVNAARATGPALAGVIIATAGVGVCFLLNAASFVAVVYSLISMDPKALQSAERATRARGQLREGIRYVSKNANLAVPLLMMALVGTLAYEFQVSLPVVAKQAFHGGAETYGFLTAAMGIGAVGGGLVTATRGKTGLRPLTIAVLGFGLAMLFAALSPALAVEYGALALVGWGSVSFMATGNSTLQLSSSPSMRGRVMSLWAVAFMGSTPVGGPVIGWVISLAGARIGLGVGAAACLLAGALGVAVLAKLQSARAEQGERVEKGAGPSLAKSGAPAGS
jgi:MFS family permease